jgi:hypothetical protein
MLTIFTIKRKNDRGTSLANHDQSIPAAVLQRLWPIYQQKKKSINSSGMAHIRNSAG